MLTKKYRNLLSKSSRLELNSSSFRDSVARVYEKNTLDDVESEIITGELVSDFIADNRYQTIIDIVCNSGRYRRIAFENGAKRIIGLDFDSVAVGKANSDLLFDGEKYYCFEG